METTITEKKNKNRGRTVSIIIHLLLLLLVFLYTFPVQEKKPIYPPPVTVEFKFEESSLSKYARAEEGSQKKKVESKNPIKKNTPVKTTKPIEKKVVTKVPTVKKPAIKKPVIKSTPKPTPTPSKPVVTDATVDESPIEAVEEEVDDIVTPDQEVLTPEDLMELEEEAGEPEPVEDDTPSGTNSGDKVNDNPSILEGNDNGTGKGSKGSGPGASSGNDGDHGEGDVGTGNGKYDGSGRGVFGRKIVKRNLKDLFAGESSSGKIVVKFCVDRSGNAVYAEVLEAETTETDPAKLKRALKAAYGYAVEADPQADPEECGKLTFNLDVNLLRGN